MPFCPFFGGLRSTQIDWSRLTVPIRPLLAAVFLGFSISASHYTAMASLEIPTRGFTAMATPALILDTDIVSLTVLLATIFIVITNLASCCCRSGYTPCAF